MLKHLAILVILFPFLTTAQELPLAPTGATQVMVRISSGTGFFINRDGDVVTNAHVVRSCQSITVRTPLGDRKAVIKARDDTRDLAVLWVAGAVDEIAPLRWNISDLKVGDGVVVMGYPGEAGITHHYVFRKTSVTGLKGPTGEPNWLQLGNVAEHGNSGGPVLDTTGNVIAVITGKAMTYRVDSSSNPSRQAPRLIGESDIAITLAALQDFLHANSIPFYEASSGLVAYADDQLEEKATHFIVPVRCIVGPA